MTRAGERGYAMAALLAALAVMGIMLSVALPAWRTLVQREREAELVFRGQQYVQAIELFSRRTGGFPTSLEMLRDGRFIRKLYMDPITSSSFQPVYLGQATAPGVPGGPAGAQQGRGGTAAAGRGQPAAGAGAASPIAGRSQFPAGPLGRGGTLGGGPIIGVMSRSTAQSIRVYNGRNHYNEWVFVSTASTTQPGAPPGGETVPGRGGRGFPPGGARGGLRGGVNTPNRGGMRGMPLPGRGTPFGTPNVP